MSARVSARGIKISALSAIAQSSDYSDVLVVIINGGSRAAGILWLEVNGTELKVIQRHGWLVANLVLALRAMRVPGTKNIGAGFLGLRSKPGRKSVQLLHDFTTLKPNQMHLRPLETSDLLQ